MRQHEKNMEITSKVNGTFVGLMLQCCSYVDCAQRLQPQEVLLYWQASTFVLVKQADLLRINDGLVHTNIQEHMTSGTCVRFLVVSSCHSCLHLHDLSQSSDVCYSLSLSLALSRKKCKAEHARPLALSKIIYTDTLGSIWVYQSVDTTVTLPSTLISFKRISEQMVSRSSLLRR